MFQSLFNFFWHLRKYHFKITMNSELYVLKENFIFEMKIKEKSLSQFVERHFFVINGLNFDDRNVLNKRSLRKKTIGNRQECENFEIRMLQ